MDILFSITYDLKVKHKINLLENFYEKLEGLLKDCNYGKSLTTIYITFNCISMRKSFKTGMIVNYLCHKKQSQLDVEVKINHKELKLASEKDVHLIGLNALNSVLDYMLFHPIRDFNMQQFAVEFRKELDNINFLEPRAINITNSTHKYTGIKVPILGELRNPLLNQKVFSYEEKNSLIEFLHESIDKIDQEVELHCSQFSTQQDEKKMIGQYVKKFILFVLDGIMTTKNFSVLKNTLWEYIEDFQMVDLDTVCREITDDIMSDYVLMLKE